jgi:predicted O-methyltransferase YrrM
MSKYDAYKVAKEFGMMSVGEVGLLKDCAEHLPTAPMVVNIGAGAGTSALAILETRRDAFIFSIDKKVVPAERDVLQKAGLLKDNRVWRLLGDSARVGKHWPIKLDLCFVDGAHHDSAVIADIEAWKPLVKDGGFMLFHDYDHPNVPGLTVIVDDMMADWKRIGSSRYLVAFQNV